MKKSIAILLAITACLIAGNAYAIGSNSMAAYGTYWDGEKAGYGLGAKYTKSLLDLVNVEGRGGYIEFDGNANSSVIPLELAFNVSLLGVITPYAGVGMGYYIIDSPGIDNTSGYFAQAGLEFSILKVGVMTELRYVELDERYLDGLMLNAGVIWRF